MGVTLKLLELYRVDQQLRGLTGRLDAAEKYLADQDKLLGTLTAKHDTLAGQLKQTEATAHNDESEAKGIDQKIEKLRDRMNNAQTSKEHAAILGEINTLKADKGLIEERALTSMNKLEEMRKQLDEVKAEKAEREKVRAIAVKERNERKSEISARLAELNGEREKVVDDVPPPALKAYEDRLKSGEDDIMAALEEHDRRNLEYSCGSCFTMLPIELVSVLLKRGDLTKCPACKVILYMEASLKDEITTSQQKQVKKTAKAASKSKKTVPSDE